MPIEKRAIKTKKVNDLVTTNKLKQVYFLLCFRYIFQIAHFAKTRFSKMHPIKQILIFIKDHSDKKITIYLRFRKKPIYYAKSPGNTGYFSKNWIIKTRRVDNIALKWNHTISFQCMTAQLIFHFPIALIYYNLRTFR